MAVKHCLVTGDPLTPTNDSVAHIIPSALGGRLRFRGLVSKDGNNELERKFDNRLIDAYNSIMVLAGGKPDRGELGSAKVRDSQTGEQFIFEFGQGLKTANPVVNRGPDEIIVHH